MIENEESLQYFVPDEIRQVLPRQIPIYLVGGGVRDALIGRQSVDLDFVLPQQALKTARTVANALNGDFFVLDEEREIGRVIIDRKMGRRKILDFALQRGLNLEEDLKRRDFTINAIALDVHHPARLIDPLKGSLDLHDKVLRVCSDSSIRDDPVRVLRAVRMATVYQLRMQPDTLSLIRQSIDGLNEVSAERIRDEIYRLLDSPNRASSLRVLDKLGVIRIILPELESLKSITAESVRNKNKWETTLEVLQHLENLLAVLASQPDQDSGNNLLMGLVNIRLGHFRTYLNEHLDTYFPSGRSVKQTLYFATLFHQIGEIDLSAGNTAEAAKLLQNRILDITPRLQKFCLSNQEIDRIIKITENYFPPKLPAYSPTLPNRRDIFRYFNRTGEAGIEAGLLFLANQLTSAGLDILPETFEYQLNVIRTLYEAWWEKRHELISPVLYVNGDDLMQELDLKPGPILGKLLLEIKEAQAVGEVSSRQEALAYARRLLG